MLNISNNSINEYISIRDYNSSTLLRKSKIRNLPLILTISLFVLIFIILFLPWTQNIQGKGYVTTRTPQDRPQAIQSVISGRLEQWYVQEGDTVFAGDTIVFVSEVKSEYFDPALITNTEDQVNAKEESIGRYEQKTSALQDQYQALLEGRKIKLNQNKDKIEQQRNKIAIVSADLQATQVKLEIAENQLERIQGLYDKGLKTLSELQEKKQKVQEQNAKVTEVENKLANSRNDLIIATRETDAILQDYADKLSKNLSEQQSAQSSRLSAIGGTAKLRSQLGGYNRRQGMYYITAPQDGMVTKAKKVGIGEIIKEGTDIVTIMPLEYELAVEVYVAPVDLPLLSIGEEVRMRFDGWPAIVISGWPEASTGIFPGRVVTIDQIISDNGLYRILISEDGREGYKPWPEMLRVGAGVSTFILLNDVPIWYEIWRQLNGFPPDYYQVENLNPDNLKRKAPLKSVK